MEDRGIQLTSATFAKPKVQKLQLLKGIVGIIKDVATVSYPSLPADIIDTISAIKLEDETGTVGWKLISRSLVDALFTLIAETDYRFIKEEIETAHLDKALNEFLEKGSYYVNKDFLKKPDQLELIEDIKVVLDEFLMLFDFTDQERENLLSRLGRYFLYSLITEWRKNVQYYAVLKALLETPFDEAEQRVSDWHVYENHLTTQIHKPVFSESFSLAQIYVPLRAEYKVRNRQKTNQNEELVQLESREVSKFSRHVVDLEKHLLDWLRKEDRKDAIRIIRGGPGNGKSSFLKVLAARLVEKNKRVLFIPLHRLDLEGKLDETVSSFLRYDKYFSFDPINDDENPLILIFDGLDELAMQGKALTEIARSFIREVERSLANYNQVRLKLQVIVSGRDVIIQQNELEFRQDGQVLKLLPYLLTEREQEELQGAKKLIVHDQRHDWWVRYGSLKGKSYRHIPEALETDELEEITAQPLLNFLVAMSYDRGRIAFEEKTNLNEVYADLLKAVYERHYEDGNRHKSVHDLKEEHFSLVLQEIAVSAWHGTGRTTTVREIKEHFKESGLDGAFDTFIKDAEQGVVSLLAAFYFRQAGTEPDGVQTFEFTHKSFGEYLTAKRVVNDLLRIDEDLLDFRKDIMRRKGRNEVSLLVSWVTLFGPKDLDDDLMKFIINELQILKKKDPSKLKSIQRSLVVLFNNYLTNGLPIERLNPRKESFMIDNQYSINAERALLILTGCVSRLIGVLGDLNWGNITTFGDTLNRLRQQRIFYNDQLIFQHLSYISLKNVSLTGADLHNVNFEGADLSGARLINCDLRYANCKKANLGGAMLAHARLDGASLDDSNLEDADLAGSEMKGISIKNAQIKNVNMSKADLSNTYLLTDVDYLKQEDNSDLSGSVLDNSILVEANMKGVKLVGASLKRVNLNGANLKYANLEDADLSLAKVKNTNFKGANLKGVKWSKGVLERLTSNGQV